jgi:hypothetical protein
MNIEGIKTFLVDIGIFYGIYFLNFFEAFYVARSTEKTLMAT